MKPIILFYKVNPSKVSALRPILSMMGIGIKCVEDYQLSCAVGALAYPDLFESECGANDNEIKHDGFNEEFMLLCGVDSVSLDKVLNFMKKKKISVSLKAMLTETNKEWSMSKLISEIKSERDEIAKALKTNGKKTK
ncbi:MAG: DUF3783 domain-containing protein [Clostridiales bacterium]|nr:DUF3783 domain-containing protein [Clostridiales bacterium]